MSLRKTTFSQYSHQLLKSEGDLEIQSAKLMKNSTLTMTTDFNSPAGQDSLDNLLDQQSGKKSRFFFSHKIEPDDNSRILKTETDAPNTEINKVRPFRFRRRDVQPKLQLEDKLEDKNDVNDFFTGVEVPRASHSAQNKGPYKLVTFTDYVENIYGKDWFEQRERKFRRQITVQDFFDTPC